MIGNGAVFEKSGYTDQTLFFCTSADGWRCINDGHSRFGVDEPRRHLGQGSISSHVFPRNLSSVGERRLLLTSPHATNPLRHQALLRPGRFDRHVSCDLPTLLERQDIFRVHMRKLQLSKAMKSSASIERLSQLTPGRFCKALYYV